MAKRKKRKGRGGPRPGSGRPRIPDNERRDQRITLVFTPPERAAITEACAEIGLQEWGRRALLVATGLIQPDK